MGNGSFTNSLVGVFIVEAVLLKNKIFSFRIFMAFSAWIFVP